MDLATIEMPRAEARKLFLDYRRAVRERQNDEDAAIMRGYRALSQGMQVINIRDAFEAAGFDEKGLPRIALARADEKFLDCTKNWDARFAFHFPHSGWGHRCQFAAGRCRSFGGIPGSPRAEKWLWLHARAMVPNVPPALRPKAALSNYHLLFEAEWREIPRPPGDPALLKHIGGDLYAVLAVWDLTPLEQAVLSGRRA